MYCPKCLNNSLELAAKGVFHVVVNKKKMDKGRFLYNLNNETDEEILENLKLAIEEFFKWYSGFQNQESVKSIEIFTNNYNCTNGCNLGVESKLNAIDDFFDGDEVENIAHKLGEKYGIKVSLEG